MANPMRIEIEYRDSGTPILGAGSQNASQHQQMAAMLNRRVAINPHGSTPSQRYSPHNQKQQRETVAGSFGTGFIALHVVKPFERLIGRISGTNREALDNLKAVRAARQQERTAERDLLTFIDSNLARISDVGTLLGRFRPDPARERAAETKYEKEQARKLIQGQIRADQVKPWRDSQQRQQFLQHEGLSQIVSPGGMLPPPPKDGGRGGVASAAGGRATGPTGLAKSIGIGSLASFVKVAAGATVFTAVSMAVVKILGVLSESLSIHRRMETLAKYSANATATLAENRRKEIFRDIAAARGIEGDMLTKSIRSSDSTAILWENIKGDLLVIWMPILEVLRLVLNALLVIVSLFTELLRIAGIALRGLQATFAYVNKALGSIFGKIDEDYSQPVDQGANLQGLMDNVRSMQVLPDNGSPLSNRLTSFPMPVDENFKPITLPFFNSRRRRAK